MNQKNVGCTRKLTAALGIAALLCGSAFADMASYNQAMKQEDFKTAAKETLTIWPTVDVKSSQAVAIAREFGFANFLAGDYENAAKFARMLIDKDGGVTAPDDQPATSRVLLNLALYAPKKDRKTRSDLLDALAARLKSPYTDQVSMVAAEILYQDDWAASNWSNAKKSAQLAGELYARGGKSFLVQQREAEVLSGAAQFLDKHARGDYGPMVATHNAIVEDINASTDQTVRAALINLKHQAQAWTHAIEAYFQADQSDLGTIINSKLRYKNLAVVKDGVTAESAAQQPVCKGTLDVGNLSFPTRWAGRRNVGIVMLNLAFDDVGNVADSKILAEAPVDSFTDSVRQSLPSFRWRVDASADRSACRVQQKDYVVTIGFWKNCAAVYDRKGCTGHTVYVESSQRSTADNSRMD